jgi:hypothetical protein
MERTGLNRIDLTISIWVDTDDYTDIIENLDYDIVHPAVKDMELVDVNYE